MEHTGNQLPLAGENPERGTERGSPSDDSIAAFERTSKDLSSAVTLLRKLRNLAKDPTANAAQLRGLLPRTKSALIKLPVEITTKVEHWVESLSKMLKDEEARLARSFASDLEQLLRAKNLKLGGNLPRLEVSFFQLEVRQQDVRIWFGPQRESIGAVPKAAAAVTTCIDQCLTRLTSEPFDDVRFVEKVYRAYRAVLAAADAESTAQAPIDAVHRQLIVARQEPAFTQRQKLREYTRMQFGYDFYRLKQRKYRGKALQLVTATKSQTIKHLDSLWVPSDETGQGFLYSHLTFREE